MHNTRSSVQTRKKTRPPKKEPFKLPRLSKILSCESRVSGEPNKNYNLIFSMLIKLLLNLITFLPFIVICLMYYIPIKTMLQSFIGEGAL